MTSTSHGKLSNFFTTHPRNWSIFEYLNYRHHPTREPRRIVDGWKLDLKAIESCDLGCHDQEQRDRARLLLDRYNEKV